MIFIDVARYLRRTWPELFVVEPGFAGLHRRIDPCRYDLPRLAVGWAKAPDATDRRKNRRHINSGMNCEDRD